MNFVSNRSFSVLLVFTALSILGLALIPLLSISLLPEQRGNKLYIKTDCGNTSARYVESEVTSTIEGLVSSIEGIKSVESISSEGNSEIVVTVDSYSEVDKIRLHISSGIRRIFPNLPQGTSYPQILRSDHKENQDLLVSYSIYGPEDNSILRRYAQKHIVSSLSMMNGINNVIVTGGIDNNWQITYNKKFIETYNISNEDVFNAIYDYYAVHSIGSINKLVTLPLDQNDFSYSVILHNTGSEIINWATIPVKIHGNRIIYLTDIATVKRKKGEEKSYSRINANNAVLIQIYADDGVNDISLLKKITQRVKLLSERLPAHYYIDESYNSTTYLINEILLIIKRSVLTISILLVFVLIVSMNIKYMFVITMSLITNLSVALIFYYFLNIQIHLYSLAGITISFGLIIDNSVIVTDHFIKSSEGQIITVLLAATLTTILSLVVIWVLPIEMLNISSSVSLGLRDFAMIIIVNLGVSFFVAVYYVPALLKRLQTDREDSIHKRLFAKSVSNKLINGYSLITSCLIRYKKIVIICLLLIFGIPFFMLPRNLPGDSLIARIYNNTVGNQWYVENLRPHVNKYLGGSIRLFTNYVFEGSYYSEPEESKLYIWGGLPSGRNIQQLNEIFVDMEQYIARITVPDSSGIKFISRIINAQQGSIVVYFPDSIDNKLFPHYLKNILVSKSLDYGDIEWSIYGVGKGFTNKFGGNEIIDFKIKLMGYNYSDLDNFTIKVGNLLKEQPRVRNVNTSGSQNWGTDRRRIEYVLRPKSSFNNNFMIPPYAIQTYLSRNTQQNNYHSFHFNGRNEKVIIVSDNNEKMDKWMLNNQPMDTVGNKLMQFANIVVEPEEYEVRKINQNYVRVVNFQYIGRYASGKKLQKRVVQEIEPQLPLGYKIESIGFGNWNSHSGKYYTLILILIGLVIFFTCSILFESLTKPIIIILTIPVSFIGIFLTFYVFDINFDQGGYASFLLVSGLVVNSAIYILNEYYSIKTNIGNGINISSYLMAFNRKIAPIMITVFSTALGLLPFLLSKEEVFWFALASGTIGGLLFSILVILFVLPVFVDMFER